MSRVRRVAASIGQGQALIGFLEPAAGGYPKSETTGAVGPNTLSIATPGAGAQTLPSQSRRLVPRFDALPNWVSRRTCGRTRACTAGVGMSEYMLQARFLPRHQRTNHVELLTCKRRPGSPPDEAVLLSLRTGCKLRSCPWGKATPRGLRHIHLSSGSSRHSHPHRSPS